MVTKSRATTRALTMARAAGARSFYTQARPTIKPYSIHTRTISTSQLVGSRSVPSKTSQYLAKAAVFGPAVALSAAVIAQATGLAQKAQELFNPKLFDKELSCDEFSHAIVRIYNIQNTLTRSSYNLTSHGTNLIVSKSNPRTGSAFIVRSEQHPDTYFVITAAHCVQDNHQQVIWINYPRLTVLLVEPVIVDRLNDIAILHIGSQELKVFKRQMGRNITAIPARQLSHLKLHTKNKFEVQGYPWFIPFGVTDIYRKTFILGRFQKLYSYLSGDEFYLSSDEQRSLKGISGGPLIIKHGNKAQISGVVVKQGLLTKRIIPSGVGQLPEYLKRAEHIQKKRDDALEELALKIRQLELNAATTRYVELNSI